MKKISVMLINRKADARIRQKYKITSKAFAICCKFVRGIIFRLSLRNY